VGCTPRGVAGLGLLAAGRGVGVRLCGAEAGIGAGGADGRASCSSSSSHGLAGMEMPSAGRSSTGAAPGGALRRGLTTLGALISPEKLAIRPCDSGA
jgi:hypothetical protein